MATARQEILRAFHRLEARTGRKAFSPKEIVDEVMSVTDTLEESTIRTYVVSVMCADAPVHHANHTDDLRRVRRGMYSLIAASDPPSATIPEPPQRQSPRQHKSPRGRGDRPWHWEGHVQAEIVAALAADGWRVLSVADTESRNHGTDIVASRSGRRLHVEVKGFPTDTYARGEKRGQPKRTPPSVQARVWFSGALMKAAMLRNEHPDDLVAIGLPSFETYRALSTAVTLTLNAARIGLIWVEENGDTSLTLSNPDVNGTGA